MDTEGSYSLLPEQPKLHCDIFQGGWSNTVQGPRLRAIDDQHPNRVRDLQDFLHVANRAVAYLPDLQTRVT